MQLLDRSTTLCLACSSSLPPLRTYKSKPTSSVDSLYTTKCCMRPICPSCIASNPRLTRYHPCLVCLGGVGVVRIASNPIEGILAGGPNLNLGGVVRDQDTFVLGDDEDEDVNEIQSQVEPLVLAPPPPYQLLDVNLFGGTSEEQRPSPLKDSESSRAALESGSNSRSAPYKYYLERTDTLQGIALRFGLNGHEICKLNNIAPSVIRTTPHLLHTRAFIMLPPSPSPHPSQELSAEEEDRRKENLVRERAERRLQMLTKEVDWRVAKAYVALADDPQEQDEFDTKEKDAQFFNARSTSNASSGPSGTRGLEVAIERYLDDEEWEAEERRAGRGFQTLKFPLKGDRTVSRGEKY